MALDDIRSDGDEGMPPDSESVDGVEHLQLTRGQFTKVSLAMLLAMVQGKAGAQTPGQAPPGGAGYKRKPKVTPAKAAEKVSDDPLEKLRAAIKAEGGHVDAPQLHLMGKEHLAPNGIAPIGYRPREVRFTKTLDLGGREKDRERLTYYGSVVRTLGDFLHISSHARVYAVKNGRQVELKPPADLKHEVVQSEPHGNSVHRFAFDAKALRGISSITFNYSSRYLEPMYAARDMTPRNQLAAYDAEFPRIAAVAGSMVGTTNADLQNHCNLRAKAVASSAVRSVPYKLIPIEGVSTNQNFKPSDRNSGHYVVCAHSGNALALLDPQTDGDMVRHGAVPDFIPTGITGENKVGQHAFDGMNIGKYYHNSKMDVSSRDLVRIAAGDTRLSEAELAYAEALVKLRNEKAYRGAAIPLLKR